MHFTIHLSIYCESQIIVCIVYMCSIYSFESISHFCWNYKSTCHTHTTNSYISHFPFRIYDLLLSLAPSAPFGRTVRKKTGKLWSTVARTHRNVYQYFFDLTNWFREEHATIIIILLEFDFENAEQASLFQLSIRLWRWWWW